MAHGTYRSAAFANLIQDLLRRAYMQQLPIDVGQLSRMFFEQQRPIFEDIIKNYYGGAAGLGQAVPGEGLSSAATEGLLEDVMNNYMAQITGQATQAAMMPWQSQFGAAPGPEYLRSGQQFQEQMRWAQQKESAGQQSGIAGSAMSCCFIFTEANNGVLDRIARRYRDEHGTPKQAVGYTRLSMWLVPLMKKHPIIKFLVKWLMVKPMIWWGKAFYGETKLGYIFYPFPWFWLKTYEFIGKRFIKEIRKCLLQILSSDFYSLNARANR